MEYHIALKILMNPNYYLKPNSTSTTGTSKSGNNHSISHLNDSHSNPYIPNNLKRFAPYTAKFIKERSMRKIKNIQAQAVIATWI